MKQLLNVYATILLFTITIKYANAQCSVIPTNLQELVTQSTTVVEGTVIKTEGIWDSQHRNIYTVNTILVSKSFKAPLIANTIKVITLGGIVGLEMHDVNVGLKLNVGDAGIFTLRSNNNILGNRSNYFIPYGNIQGFVKYSKYDGSAATYTQKFNSIDEVYRLIESHVGTSKRIIQPLNHKYGSNTNRRVAPVITSFSTSEGNDHSAIGGVGEFLTINGSNFGNSGSVFFPDANNGGSSLATFNTFEQIVSWTPNQVVLEVPYRAGTGVFVLQNNTLENGSSPSALTIISTQINIQYNNGSGLESYAASHRSINSNGGLLYAFNNEFVATSDAAATMEDIFSNFGCTTKINFKRGENTEIDVAADDDVNVVRFDNGSEVTLPTLAYAQSRYSGYLCGNGDVLWNVTEVDVVANDFSGEIYSWYYGSGTPPTNHFDFETIMLHEIGHAHQFGHIIDFGEVMHYAVTVGAVNRTLSANDIELGDIIVAESTSIQTCGPAPMTLYAPEITASCQNFTVSLDASGNASITTANIDNGSIDECGNVPPLFLSQISFTCANLGSNSITLTAGTGANTATCTAVVTVQDVMQPTAVCQDIAVELVGDTVTITAADVDGGSSDNCGIASLLVTPSTFDLDDVGANNVTLTVTDTSGNTSSCTAVVTVTENPPPAMVCQDITVQLGLTGTVDIIPTDIDNGSSDPDGIASLTLDIDTFDCSDVGTVTVTLTGTDTLNNSSSCTATVTVEDHVAPTVVCQDITVQLDVLGNAVITAADVDGGSSDACGIASTSIDVSSFDCSDVGANNVVLTVTDVNGNTGTCTATVTVEDNVAPTAVCQNITVQLDANGMATIIPTDIDDGSSDNCDFSLSIDTDTFNCADVGPNNVILTITDISGNIDSCSAIVTVEDNIAPTAVCQDITVQLNATGNVSILPAHMDGGSSDACGIATVTIDRDTFDCSDMGPNNVILSLTDVNGNTSSCTAIVTVEDTMPPVITCQDIMIQLDENGVASITTADVTGVSTDDCGVASSSIDIDTFDCSSVGPNNVILTVTDNNGNTSTCTATVTVEDNVAPTAVCQNITVQLDANGNATITAADVDGDSTDACGIASATIDVSTFDCSNVGANNVVLTVTDNNGNISTCTAVVTVEDNVTPTAVCQNITVQLDENGNATITAADVDGGSSDACGIASATIDVSTFDCSNIGSNNVILTVTDVNGNVSTCTAIVTVEDVAAPIVVCPTDQSVVPGSGNVFYIVPDYFATGEVTAVDNCTDPVTIITQEPAADTAIPEGIYTVTLTAEDQYGNSGTCNFELTVESVLGTGGHSQNLGSVTLYPNPTKGQVTIGNPQSLELEVANIYDLTGRLVQSFSLKGVASAKTLKADNLAAATYVVIIKGSQGQITKRLIKE